jgi:hypothetical protein
VRNSNETVVEMAYSVGRLVLNPDGFFDKEAESPRLWVPALIVLLVGVVRVARSLYVNDFTTSAMETGGGGPGAAGGMSALFTLPSLVTPFVSWLVVSGVILAVSAYLGGEGSASDTVAVAGWGFVPALVGALVTFGLTYHFLSGTNPSGVQEVVDVQRSLFETLSSAQVRGFGYVLVGWQAFIWCFGVRHAQSLELRRAAVPAVVAGALVVGWDLFGGAVLVRIMGVFL